ncbi:MAG: hypothetical protein WBQ73_01530 [Candidatus Babeliales bacterium]
MLLSLNTAHYFIVYVARFLAYFIVVPIAGTFKAYLAKKCGDNTGENLGYLSLNPLDHLDFFGLVFFVLMGIGIARTIPVNINNITSPGKAIKVFLVFFADVFAYIVLGIISIIFLVLTSHCPHAKLASAYKAFGYIVSNMLRLCITFILIYAIFNTMHLILTLFYKNNLVLPTYVYYALFIIPFILLFFFGNILYVLIFNAIASMGIYCAQSL